MGIYEEIHSEWMEFHYKLQLSYKSYFIYYLLPRNLYSFKGLMEAHLVHVSVTGQFSNVFIETLLKLIPIGQTYCGFTSPKVLLSKLSLQEFLNCSVKGLAKQQPSQNRKFNRTKLQLLGNLILIMVSLLINSIEKDQRLDFFKYHKCLKILFFGRFEYSNNFLNRKIGTTCLNKKLYNVCLDSNNINVCNECSLLRYNFVFISWHYIKCHIKSESQRRLATFICM